MFKIPRSNSGQPSWPPSMDLSTVRDTLTYMRDDMRRVAGLERVADALDDALIEIAVSEQNQPTPIPTRFKPEMQFVKWQPLRHPNASGPKPNK